LIAQLKRLHFETMDEIQKVIAAILNKMIETELWRKLKIMMEFIKELF
jgi:hypothetical protein